MHAPLALVALFWLLLLLLLGCASGSGLYTTCRPSLGQHRNISNYCHKSHVCITGGPARHWCSGAHLGPEGDYYFQVTDPTGQVLLSCDKSGGIERNPEPNRRFHVNQWGLIDRCYGDGTYPTEDFDCGGNDGRHNLLIGLHPFLDCPTHEYKVWVTPVHAYNGSFIPDHCIFDSFNVTNRTDDCQQTTTPSQTRSGPAPPPPRPPPTTPAVLVEETPAPTPAHTPSITTVAPTNAPTSAPTPHPSPSPTLTHTTTAPTPPDPAPEPTPAPAPAFTCTALDPLPLPSPPTRRVESLPVVIGLALVLPVLLGIFGCCVLCYAYVDNLRRQQRRPKRQRDMY